MNQNTDHLVSVIVTTYNRKELLKDTIYSILNQTYSNFELIIVDNYSNYDFYSFIKSIADQRIRAFQNYNDGCIAINRNYGINKANGKYVAFCDDDDIWRKEKLNRQMQLLKNQPDLTLVCCLGKKIGVKTSFWQLNYGVLYRKHDLSYEGLIINNTIILSSVLVRRDKLLMAKSFSTFSDLISVEDLDLWLKLSRFGKFCYMNEILINYRIHNTNVSREYKLKQEAYLNQFNKLGVRNSTNWIQQNRHSRLLIIMKNIVHLCLILILSINSIVKNKFNITLITNQIN